ncbi:MAG: hypothetical protein ABH872_05630, partial [Candidatus Omnitrophota bacterium]
LLSDIFQLFLDFLINGYLGLWLVSRDSVVRLETDQLVVKLRPDTFWFCNYSKISGCFIGPWYCLSLSSAGYEEEK